MFDGNFKESTQNSVKLNFENSPMITEESLDLVLASFYSSEIEFTKANVQSILVTARFLQCEEIVNKCEKFMTRIVSKSNCCSLYYFCQKYYLPNLEGFIFRFLLVNLMIVKTNNLLYQMKIELWTKLIKHSGFVVETEFILYQVLRHFVRIRMLVKALTDKRASVTIDTSYFKQREGKILSNLKKNLLINDFILFERYRISVNRRRKRI